MIFLSGSEWDSMIPLAIVFIIMFSAMFSFYCMNRWEEIMFERQEQIKLLLKKYERNSHGWFVGDVGEFVGIIFGLRVDFRENPITDSTRPVLLEHIYVRPNFEGVILPRGRTSGAR